MPYIKDRSGGNLFWYFSNLIGAVEKHKESLRFADLQDQDLKGVCLSGGSLEGADLSGANLSDAHFENTNFRFALLRRVNLSFSTNSSHTVDFTQADANRACFCGSFFPRSNFSEGRFIGADFELCRLTGSNFHYTNLNQSSLKGCSLTDCSFLGSTLIQANLNNSIIQRVDFRAADLALALVEQCGTITGNFKEATLEHTSFFGSTLPKEVEVPQNPSKQEPSNLSRFERLTPRTV
jgi:uncharacterized protein YjbI with pentapeptide repeats